MKTNFILYILAAVVVVGGVAAYIVVSKPTETDMSQKNSSQENGGVSGIFNGSLAELTRKEANARCTFATDSVESRSTGEVFVRGSDIRGNFSSEVKETGAKVESYMIQTGGYMYVWSPLSEQGFKTKIKTDAGSTQESSGQGVSLDSQYTFDCTPVSPDASLFVVPTGVSFIDSTGR